MFVRAVSVQKHPQENLNLCNLVRLVILLVMEIYADGISRKAFPGSDRHPSPLGGSVVDVSVL